MTLATIYVRFLFLLDIDDRDFYGQKLTISVEFIYISTFG